MFYSRASPQHTDSRCSVSLGAPGSVQGKLYARGCSQHLTGTISLNALIPPCLVDNEHSNA